MPNAFALRSPGDDTFSRAALEADWRLAEAAEGLQFLLHVTPTDTDAAWRRFAAASYQGEPDLAYRPLACDLDRLEACVEKAPVDDVPNPTAAELLREKRDELRLKVAMLRHRGTPRFLELSRRVYGEVDDGLLELAKRLLYRLPAEARGEPVKGRLDAAAFAVRAERELQHYRRLHPEFAARVEVSSDVPPS
ncbi:MAG TPA: tyrosine/phenylalanine carboxypeptidase domain-containing protein, partial [Thermoanaerobaculia bacterium]|nr:tyrosine/phenylalanine carboxypeptidase domain-containing protein [Thermoanaerobaculia bacterium]